MRLFRRDRLHVIVLAPVAIYAISEGGGCASTPEVEPGDLTAEQITATISGNTFKLADQEAYAFVAEDGGLRGLNVPSGATRGQWRVNEDGQLCATWETPDGALSRCDALTFVGDDVGYEWNENALQLLEGNPQDL